MSEDIFDELFIIIYLFDHLFDSDGACQVAVIMTAVTTGFTMKYTFDYFLVLCVEQGRSHGCARVCRCHPQWQLAHLKTDAE